MSEHFTDPSVRKSLDVDLTLVAQYDTLITDLELTIVRQATGAGTAAGRAGAQGGRPRFGESSV